MEVRWSLSWFQTKRQAGQCVIQGHDNIQDVINSPEPYLSTCNRPLPNRICKGKFQLHGKSTASLSTMAPIRYTVERKDTMPKVWDALK